MRHIIIPTQYYDPEIFQVNELVRLFIAEGWRVTVIAPLPSYPDYRDYKKSPHPKYTHPFLNVIRLNTPLRSGDLASTFFNSLVFALLASPVAIFYCLKYPYAQLFCLQYSPITSILPGAIASFLLRRKASLWIFDLWSESLSVRFKSRAVRFILKHSTSHLVSFLYKSFSSLYVSSPAFLHSSLLQSNGSVKLLYSWDDVTTYSQSSPAPCDPAQLFHISSIGNLGSSHDLEFLELLLLAGSSLHIRWSFIGSGHGMDRLRTYCEKKLIANVQFHGLLTKTIALQLCRESDLSLIPFRACSVSQTIPFRFISSLSVATPILSLGKSSVSSRVVSNNLGFVLFRDASISSLALTLQIRVYSTLLLMVEHRSRLTNKHLRKKCFEYYETNFSIDKARNTLSELFD